MVYGHMFLKFPHISLITISMGTGRIIFTPVMIPCKSSISILGYICYPVPTSVRHYFVFITKTFVYIHDNIIV